jgi:hypothetical protein
MRDHETVKSAIEAAASSPKVATLVAAGAASAGAATQFDMLQGVMSIISMSVGIVTALVVLAIQLIKLHRNYTAWQRGEPDPYEK